MEEQEKSQEQILKERIEMLEMENKELAKSRDMYEGWWKAADNKNKELAEAIKSIGTIAKIIYNTVKY